MAILKVTMQYDPCGVIGHGGSLIVFYFTRPVREFWACLGDSPPRMPRRPEIRFLCLKVAPLSSGRLVPGVTIAEGNHSSQ